MIDLDDKFLELECERCQFMNWFSLGDVQAERVIICRGCLTNIKLVDHERQAEGARSEIEHALSRLGGLGKKVEIKISL